MHVMHVFIRMWTSTKWNFVLASLNSREMHSTKILMIFLSCSSIPFLCSNPKIGNTNNSANSLESVALSKWEYWVHTLRLLKRFWRRRCFGNLLPMCWSFFYFRERSKVTYFFCEIPCRFEKNINLLFFKIFYLIWLELLWYALKRVLKKVHWTETLSRSVWLAKKIKWRLTVNAERCDAVGLKSRKKYLWHEWIQQKLN